MMFKDNRLLDLSVPVSILWILAVSLLLVNTAMAAPSFIGLNGARIDLESYRGKWIVVNYWATWCPPCLEEIPELVHFHETHKDTDAVVIGINMEETSSAALSSFVDDNMMSYPIVPMREDMPLVGNIPGLPTTYMIDPAGRVVAQKVGQVTMNMLENFIKKNTK